MTTNVEESEVSEQAADMHVEDALKYIGIASIVLGFVLAMIMLNQSGGYNESVKSTFQVQALVYFAGGIVSGSVMIGFSKALEILIELNNKIS